MLKKKQKHTHTHTEADIVLKVIPPQAVSVFCLVLSTGFQEMFPSVGSAKRHDLFKHKGAHLKSFSFEVIRQQAFSGVMAVCFFLRLGEIRVFLQK